MKDLEPLEDLSKHVAKHLECVAIGIAHYITYANRDGSNGRARVGRLVNFRGEIPPINK